MKKEITDKDLYKPLKEKILKRREIWSTSFREGFGKNKEVKAGREYEVKDY